MRSIIAMLEDDFLKIEDLEDSDRNILKNYLMAKLDEISKGHFLQLCSYENRQLLECVRKFYSYEKNSSYDDKSIKAIVGNMIEDHLFDDKLKYNTFKSNQANISFSKNNIQDKYALDVKVNGTNLYIDIKSRLIPYYNGTGRLNAKTTLYLNNKTADRYYEQIKNGEVEDIWLMTYYNYDPYQSDIIMMSIKKMFNIVKGVGTPYELNNCFRTKDSIIYNRNLGLPLESFFSYLMDNY